MRAILTFVLLAIVLLNVALSHRHGGPHHGNRHHETPFSFAKITSLDLYFEGKKIDGITQSTERKEKILNQFVQQNFGLQQQNHEHEKEVEDDDDDTVDVKLPVSTDLFSRAKANILFLLKSAKSENFGASRLLQKWSASFKSSSVHMVNVAAEEKLFGKLPEAAQVLSKVNDDLVDVATSEKLFTYKQSAQSAQQQLEEELEAIKAVFAKLEAAKKDLITPSFYVFSLSSALEKMTSQEERAKATATVAEFMDKFFQEHTQVLGEVVQDVQQEQQAKQHRFAGHRRLLMVEGQLQSSNTTNYNDTIAKTLAIGDYQTQVWTAIMIIILLFAALYLMHSIEYAKDAMIYHVKDDDVDVGSK